MAKLRLSLVGCGCISRSHTRAFSEFADRCEIVWAADPDLERANERAEAIGCRYTDDYRNTLDEVDAVILGTPHHLHAPHTIEVADATCMRNRLMRPQLEAEDTAVMLMRFAGGALANYTCTWGNPYASSKCAAIIRCEKGQLFLSFKEDTLRVTTDTGEEVLLETPKYFPKIDQAQHFLDCIRDKKEPLTGGREGLTSGADPSAGIFVAGRAVGRG